MKVVVERSAILKTLTHIQRVVEKRNTIPILSNVLVRAADGRLTFVATDLDMEILETIPARVEQAGDPTIPAHMLYDIIRKLPDGAEVRMEMTGDTGQVAIRSGKSRFNILSLPSSDFPNLATGDMSATFSLTAAELGKLISRTQFAISTEETRYYLNGIYMHVASDPRGPMLRAVATDGHRLARCQIPAPQGADLMGGIIVPRKTVIEITKLLASQSADTVVGIETSLTKIRLTIGEVVLTSKLIDGTFPDYQRVIPVSNEKILTVDRAAFEEGVDRVSTVSSERGRAIKLALDDGRLVLSVTTPEAGSAQEEIEVDYADAALEVGFNARYLLDILGQISGDRAVVKLDTPGTPSIFEDAKDDASLFILMPMRT